MSAAPSATERRKRAAKASPSGRLLLRMPAELHAELAQCAEREGVSLNQFITRTLAGRIGWGAEGESADAVDSPAGRRTNVIAVALVANAIVIGLAAAAAIGVLVLAWRG
ncbi:MAG: toxin-antitoxin system HicB family antitoxin [Thermoleophilia bacterium]|nr:toxin-antitoxin system HicB family antitoxin [Thermoleophilia bacterium]